VAGDALALDAAIAAALRADVALMAACPGGVFYGLAPSGVEAFVVFQRIAAADDLAMFAGAAGEEYHYLVKAVVPGTQTNAAGVAARRIDAVLDGNAALAPDGYALQAPIAREEAVRYPETDDLNPDRWVQHIGGQYVVQVQAIDTSREGRDHAVPR
jgi:hypothetical protein